MFITTRSLADGLRLFLSAIVLQEMTGIPIHWAVIAMGVAKRGTKKYAEAETWYARAAAPESRKSRTTRARRIEGGS